MTDPNGPEQRFEEAFRAWATRPTQLEPGQAARAVVDAIRRREDRRTWWRLGAVAASLVAAVVTGALWYQGRPVAPAPAIVARLTEPLGDGVVLMWLDPETPLYMTYQVPGPDGDRGDTTP